MSEKKLNEVPFGEIVVSSILILLFVGLGYSLDEFALSLNFPITSGKLWVLYAGILLLPVLMLGFEASWFGFVPTKAKKKEMEKARKKQSFSERLIKGILLFLLIATMAYGTIYVTHFFIAAFNITYITTFTFISFFFLPNLTYILFFFLIFIFSSFLGRD